MFALLLMAVAAILILRAGFGLFALFFKLIFALFGLAFGALVTLSALGLVLLLGGGLAFGVVLLVALALTPIWLPLAIGGFLLWMLVKPARVAGVLA